MIEKEKWYWKINLFPFKHIQKILSNIAKKLLIYWENFTFSFFFITQTAVSAREVKEMDKLSRNGWKLSRILNLKDFYERLVMVRFSLEYERNHHWTLFRKFWFWQLRFQQFSASPDTLTIQQKWKSEKVEFMH